MKQQVALLEEVIKEIAQQLDCGNIAGIIYQQGKYSGRQTVTGNLNWMKKYGEKFLRRLTEKFLSAFHLSAWKHMSHSK